MNIGLSGQEKSWPETLKTVYQSNRRGSRNGGRYDKGKQVIIISIPKRIYLPEGLFKDLPENV